MLLVLDAKRGDIGSTAEQYAREAFDRYGAHAVTVNPYLGTDSVEPFLRHPDGGVFVLCRTSNPGSGDFQSLAGRRRAAVPARRPPGRREWNAIGDCGLVVGRHLPRRAARGARLVGDLPLLVPGVGAQGGDVEATVQAGADSSGYGMVINSSRAILYASSGADFAEAARRRSDRAPATPSAPADSCTAAACRISRRAATTLVMPGARRSAATTSAGTAARGGDQHDGGAGHRRPGPRPCRRC